jgi:microsomal epoxide hydrolase
MTLLNPYTIKIDNDVINGIYERISSFLPWKNLIEVEGWEHGTDPSYMKELCDYWINQFNWREQESKINKFNNYKTSINDIETHFIYEKGSGDSPTPLLMNHGWPGSIVEFLDIIEPLAHPERFGGDISDSFDVIVPSLPGFSFSEPISRAYGPREIASIFNILMTERLDYKSYIAQGGDWGSAVAS